MSESIRVSGTGCCLVDHLYNNISFGSDAMAPYLSRRRGDGGLTPGQLVFREELEEFAGKDLEAIVASITGDRSPDKINIGGPSIVALIHAAQMTVAADCSFHFYGCRGNDDSGEFIYSSLDKTPVDHKQYEFCERQTPLTIVLSDPMYNEGHGERMFVNAIGGAWEYGPENLDKDFFSSDIVVFGGTALVPRIHSGLTGILEAARTQGCISIVNTVFDFLSEKENPGQRWPLGSSDETYALINLLIMDLEEALCLSGKKDPQQAMDFFRERGTGAVVITGGADDILVYSVGNLFEPVETIRMPVSESILRQVEKGTNGDTTGCGDNFAGGIIASLAEQMVNADAKPDLKEACTWGVISGGYSCFYLGGTYLEKSSGEKRKRLEPYYEKYKEQFHG